MTTCYIYILECINSNFYIGYTIDIERRYREHCEGSAKCKYTRSFPPKRIAACWSFDTENKGSVLQIESRLKRLTKLKKRALIENKKLLSNYTQLNYQILGAPLNREL